MRPGLWGGLPVFALLLLSAAEARAEWQVKPFVGLTFGGSTTFVDLEHAAGGPNGILGVSGVWLGEVFGIDADVGYAPGFFQGGDQHLVVGSSVTTLTGNIMIALPRRLSNYTLRPYFVGGAGLLRVRIEDFLDALPVAQTLPAMDIGGGVTGFLTKRIGLSWEARCFRSVRAKAEGVSIGREQLSFCRANIGFAIRY